MTTQTNQTAKAPNFPINIRDARESDRAWIMSTWLDANRRSPLANYLSNTVYFGEHRKYIEKLIASSINYVAAWDKDDDQLFGWICGDRIDDAFVVHFLYTKQKFRRLGIAQKLLCALGYIPGEPIIATHVTYIYTDTGLSKRKNIVNNPYVAQRVVYEAQVNPIFVSPRHLPQGSDAE